MAIIVLFDLDNTLIKGDSDFLWNQYLIDENLVDIDLYEQKNNYFLTQYEQGQLDINEYLRFTLKVLKEHSIASLNIFRKKFIENYIVPIIPKQSHEIIKKHNQLGHKLAIITATNYFITKPIAVKLNIANLITHKPEIIDNCYTGEYIGIPCFQAGKINYFENWAKQFTNIEETWFYSDSINDLPLLSYVDVPIVVNANAELQAIAKAKSWQSIVID